VWTSGGQLAGEDEVRVGGGPNGAVPGITGMTGPNNIGLLVTAWGRVLDTPDSSVYHLDDGSTPGGLPIMLLGRVSASSQGSYASVVGIAEPGAVLQVSTGDFSSH
jgi:hypothetical protein